MKILLTILKTFLQIVTVITPLIKGTITILEDNGFKKKRPL